MVARGRPWHHHTYQEYLAAARDSAIKLEFADGEIHAMAGASKRHNALALRVGAVLHAGLRETCIAYQSDQRVRVPALNRAVYPDVTVTCGAIETDPLDAETIMNPVLIVEVLSPSTEQYDRGEKWLGYQTLPSLQEYVLVSQYAQRIECYQRLPSGAWEYREAADRITLGIGVEIDLADLYRGLPE